MNHPLLLFSGDHAESFSPGVAQNEDEEAEKKKESNVEHEGLHGCLSSLPNYSLRFEGERANPHQGQNWMIIDEVPPSWMMIPYSSDLGKYETRKSGQSNRFW